MTEEQRAVDALLVEKLKFKRTYHPTTETFQLLQAMEESGEAVEIPADLKHRDTIIDALQELGFEL